LIARQGDVAGETALAPFEKCRFDNAGRDD
jgi:hypothetical protein